MCYSQMEGLYEGYEITKSEIFVEGWQSSRILLSQYFYIIMIL